ncbi:hypothetical protein ACN27F_00365 [Solwaraspora sp. WMMB335]|uniref:hypothetical protein n=1 Tax=Solwaraspora sp. WMMB335 TaxID=3404118 RepID=UPI003B92730A
MTAATGGRPVQRHPRLGCAGAGPHFVLPRAELLAPEGRGSDGIDVARDLTALYLAYVAVATTLAPLVLFLLVRDPVDILSVGGIVAAAHTPVVVGLTLYVNRRHRGSNASPRPTPLILGEQRPATAQTQTDPLGIRDVPAVFRARQRAASTGAGWCRITLVSLVDPWGSVAPDARSQ